MRDVYYTGLIPIGKVNSGGDLALVFRVLKGKKCKIVGVFEQVS